MLKSVVLAGCLTVAFGAALSAAPPAPKAAAASAQKAGTTPAPKPAIDEEGVFVVNDGQARVKVEPCTANLCGTIVWVSDPIDPETGKPRLDRNNPNPQLRSHPIIGLKLFELTPDGTGQWKGQIYNSRDGKNYDITLKADGQALNIQGCILGSLLCRTQVWPRYAG